MGCTSSTPNMAPMNTHATEKQLQFHQEIKDHVHDHKEDAMTIESEEENGKSEIKVLPPCDTLAEPVQLDSINKIIVESSKMDPDEELKVIEVIDNVPAVTEAAEVTEEKLSSLEDIVEKVVELLTENTHSQEYFELSTESVSNKQGDKATKDEMSTQPNGVSETATDGECEESYGQHNEGEEDTQEGSEAASPSHSSSSRATRWEALADVAAELPPSLAVDPLTGQIYALK